MKTIKIDSEFSALCTPHTPAEISALVNQIAGEGCREPLVVWAEEGLLVDGHLRYRVCRDLGLAFEVTQRSFASRQDVLEWIMLNQLARRNITPRQRAYFVGKLYLAQRGRRGNRQRVGCSAAVEVAAVFNTSARTAERSGRFAAAVDSIAAAVGPEARNRLLCHTCGITMADVGRLAESPFEVQQAALSDPTTAGGDGGHRGAAANSRQASPASRWEKSLHELLTLVASTKDAGGVRQLTLGWSETERHRYARGLAEMAETLKGLANELSESEVAHAG